MEEKEGKYQKAQCPSEMVAIVNILKIFLAEVCCSLSWT